MNRRKKRRPNFSLNSLNTPDRWLEELLARQRLLTVNDLTQALRRLPQPAPDLEPVRTGALLNNLAMYAKDSGWHAIADRLFERAALWLRGTDAATLLPLILANWASARRDADELDGSLIVAREAATLGASSEVRARCELEIGLTLKDLGRADEAERHLVAAHEAGRSAEAAIALSTMSLVLDRPRVARRWAIIAARTCRREGDIVNVAIALENLAQAHASGGSVLRALRCAIRAAAAARRSKDERGTAMALMTLAGVQSDVGQFRDARRSQVQAGRLFGTLKLRGRKAEVRVDLAYHAMRNGRLGAARQHAHRAVVLATSVSWPAMSYSAYRALGNALELSLRSDRFTSPDAAKMLAAAMAAYEQAAMLAERAGDAIEDDEIATRISSDERYEPFERMAEIWSLWLNKPSNGFEWAERGKARALQRLLLRSVTPHSPYGRATKFVPNYSAICRLIERGSSSVRVGIIEYFVTEGGSLAFLVLSGRPEPMVWRLAWEDGAEVTTAQLRSFATRLAIDFHGGMIKPGAELERAAFALPPKTGRPRRTYDEPPASLDGVGMDYLNILGDALLPRPLLDALDAEGVELICFVPHGPLHAVPFAALPVGGQGATASVRLVERFGSCVAPSAGVLLQCAKRNRRRADPAHTASSLLTLAVAFDGDDDPSLEADADIFEAHRGAGRHLDTRIGPVGGSKASFLAHHDHDVVHVACHGISFESRDEALNSGLFLSDGSRRPSRGMTNSATSVTAQAGFLSAREIFALDLRADLVCLRACSSGRSHVAAGDEPLGIVRGLLAGGASSMLVTKWNVDVESSGRLIRAFYDRWLGSPERPAKWRALRDAQLAMIEQPASPAERHPYHWAAVELVGDWI